MKLHELERNIGATHSKKRVGRGSRIHYTELDILQLM